MAKRKLEDDKEFQAKAINYISMLMSGKKVTEKVKYADFTFEVAYPLPSDLKEIDQSIARACKGMPPASFTPKALLTFEVYATLDQVVVNGPSWWKALKSADQCPFDDLVMYLYRRWLRFYREVRRYLTPTALNPPNRGSDQIPSEEPSSEDMGDDVFSDIAYGPEVE